MPNRAQNEFLWRTHFIPAGFNLGSNGHPSIYKRNVFLSAHNSNMNIQLILFDIIEEQIWMEKVLFNIEKCYRCLTLEQKYPLVIHFHLSELNDCNKNVKAFFADSLMKFGSILLNIYNIH